MIRPILAGLLLTLTSMGSGSAAPVFVAPDESVPLIRRDLAPLDSAAIVDLAHALTTLVDSPLKNNAISLRQRAQILALTLRLSPSQSRAREILRSTINGDFQPAIQKDLKKSARDHGFLTAKWLLEMPEESEGRHLGNLLLDVLAPYQSDHPLLEKRTSTDEDRWQGVIAPLAAFANASKTQPLDPTPKTPQRRKYATTGLLTTTPLVTVTNGQIKHGAVNVSLILTEQGEGKLKFKPALTRPGGPTRSTQPLHDALIQFYQDQDRPLPQGYDLYVDTGRGSYAERNKENIAAPLAMMLDAASTGRPLAPNIVLFARLGADGSLSRPFESWPLIHSLRDKRPTAGTRLLVPPELVEELTALLVLEHPSFLLRFEIISCGSFDEARQIYLEDAQLPDDIQAASKIFKEVTEALRKTSDGNIAAALVYDSVKSRLKEAAEASPRHLSAQILLKQASGKRPSSFSTPMFAREFIRITESLTSPPAIDYNSSSKGLKTFQSEQKALLAEFRESRRISRDDDPLIEEGKNLIDKLRPIIRLIDKDQSIPATLQLTLWRQEVTLFRDRLKRLTGDSAQ
jgi:hypothetical protein